MKSRQVSVLFLLVGCIWLSLVCSAETITFSSGKILKGNIIEETDVYIMLENEGVTLKYFKDDIVRINREKTPEKPEVPVVKRVANASSTSDLITITLKEDPNKDLPEFVKKLDALREEIIGIVENAKGKLSAIEGAALTADHRAIMQEAAEAMQAKVALMRNLQVPPAARGFRDVAVKIADVQAKYFNETVDSFTTMEQLKAYWEQEILANLEPLSAQYRELYERLNSSGKPATK